MYSCYSILECYNMFSGVKLSKRSICFISNLSRCNYKSQQTETNHVIFAETLVVRWILTDKQFCPTQCLAHWPLWTNQLFFMTSECVSMRKVLDFIPLLCENFE